MNISEFIKKELDGWGKYERIIFPLEILLIIVLSIIINDDKIALVSAVCGISYTILAGKGKISCYFFGLCGTLCYAYISFKNQLLGNLALYLCYYLPVQIFGIFKWSEHLKKDSQEIEKTCLKNRERILYFLAAAFLTIIVYIILMNCNDKEPVLDAITTTFSVFGLILTVKRCIEQWYIWFVVNGLSVIMWVEAYINGSNCFATVIMWLTYFVLSVYFLKNWEKDINTKC